MFCFTANAEHATKVVGLVNLPDMKGAWLEMHDSSTNNSFSTTSHQFMKEGDIFTDEEISDVHVQIQIIQIGFTNGTVTAEEDGKEMIYHIDRSGNVETQPAHPGVYFNNASLDSVLDLYAGITGRTMLVHPLIHQKTARVSIQAQGKSEFTHLLENVLRETNIAFIPDGEKFELIVPLALEKTLQSNLINSASLIKSDTKTPRGTLDWKNVDLEQVLNVYGALIGKKLMQERPLPNITINLRTQTPLTEAESIHALDTLFAWNGIKIVNLDDHSFKAVPISSAN